MRAMILALRACNDKHKSLPPAFDRFAGISYPVSVHVHLLPFLEEEQLYKSFLVQGRGREGNEVSPYIAPTDPSLEMRDGVQNFAANLRVFSKKGWEAPWDGDMRPLGEVEPGDARIPRSFENGTSNSIVLATKLAVCGQGGSRYAAAPSSPWAAFFGQNAAKGPAHPSDPRALWQLAPGTAECLTSPLMAQSFTTDGILAGLCDGSVRMIDPVIQVKVWNQALHPRDHRPPREW